MNQFGKVSFKQYLADRRKLMPFKMDDDYKVEAEYEQIKLPERATAGSAGYDLYAPYDIFLTPGESITVPTGIHVYLDQDKFLAVYPRSGLGFRYKLQLWNTVGVIDSDYINADNEGHIMAKLYNESPDGRDLLIKAGQGMAQGIIQQYFLTSNDSAYKTRTGGFGSTDKQG